MEEESDRNYQDVPLPGTPSRTEGGGLVGDHSGQPALCTLCRRSIAPEYEAMFDLENVGLCGDCKFLLLEDLGTPPQDSNSNRRRQAQRRRNRESSSESIENIFSQRVSQMINLLRQNQSTVSGSEDHVMDGDSRLSSARSLQRSNSRTTPGGSRRWRRVISDSESDGFDNLDSFYGESESNFSFGRYRVFRGESDVISFGTYGGDSDASMDGHSILDTEIFIQAENRSDFDIDSDTDIDPMHAGLNQWNWDDAQDDDDDEWEEVDVEEYGIGHTMPRTGPVNLFTSSQNETNPAVFNFLRSRVGFEQLIDHLAETDGSRRGAPPASLSFVNNLPRVIVSGEHEKYDGLACAICKDVLPLGIEVNQLPCRHVYHPSCILPWLSARNSCPLCRYELPTDDKDYEEGKQNMMVMHEQQQNASEDSSSEDSDESEGDEACELGPSQLQNVRHVDPTISSSAREGGRDWLFRASAPVAGILGVVLVLWLGKPLIGRRGSIGDCNLSSWGQHQIQVSSASSLNQRGSRGRRWWSLF